MDESEIKRPVLTGVLLEKWDQWGREHNRDGAAAFDLLRDSSPLRCGLRLYGAKKLHAFKEKEVGRLSRARTA
jgi:hypothetical protein